MALTDQDYIDAIKEAGSQRKAAELLGVNERTLTRRMAKISRKQQPEYRPTENLPVVPENFLISKVSSLQKEGDTLLQWVQARPDAQKVLKAMQEAVDALSEEIPRATLMRAPPPSNDQLLNVYTITDYHLGMLAWEPETGADWDTDIAERMLVDWFSHSISQAPDASSCVFAQLGDFMHFDGLDSVTPSSGHILDADTRFTRLVRVAIRVTARVIDMLLSKYQSVYVLMAEGNHDLASSCWLRELTAARYENEPRVMVETRPDPYYCYEHGLTSLFWHHGHKHRMSGIDTVFAAKFREVFGRTKYSYAHTGHLHHRELKETNLMIVEQHRTLAAPDAYASRGGWMSGRSSTVITYHREYGEVGRITLSPEMLK